MLEIIPSCAAGRHLRMVICTAPVAVLSACAPIPISTTTPALGIERYVPEDLLRSRQDLLVLTQFSKTPTSDGVFGSGEPAAQGAAIELDAEFVKGSELLAWNRTLAESRRTGIAVWAGVPIPMGFGPVGESSSIQRLTRICLVAHDAREVMITTGMFDYTSRSGLLAPGRRDAAVASLRADGNFPFDHIDGPCGMRGNVEWSMDLRSRVAAFLSGLPSADGRDPPK